MFAFVSVSLFAFYVLEKEHVFPDDFRRTIVFPGIYLKKNMPLLIFLTLLLSRIKIDISSDKPKQSKDLQFHCHFFNFLIFCGAVLAACFGGGNLINNIEALYDFAECCVLAVKVAGVLMHDKELTAG